MAYYMFVNHGWAPGRILELPFEEKALLAQMISREINNRPGKK